MAELAVTDGMPPPSDLPRGECTITRLDDGTIRVDQADPRILISGELLDLIHVAHRIPCAPPTASDIAVHVHLDMTGCMPPPYRATYVGAVLRIDGVNRQVVYRIGEYVPRIHGYIGEWPD